MAVNGMLAELKDRLAVAAAEKEVLLEQVMAGGEAAAVAASRGSDLEDEQRQLRALVDVARAERDRLRADATEAHEAVRDVFSISPASSRSFAFLSAAPFQPRYRPVFLVP